ncbi:leucyl aminopeptidase [Rhodobacteraceae bacterium]|nr:leucyl aminopeptidase [Paracoccaceae bacterium]
MKTSVDVKLKEYDLKLLEKDYDRISIFVEDTKKLDSICSRMDKLTKGSISRAISSTEFEKKSCGDVLTISFPGALSAEYLDLVKWSKSGKLNDARKAGVNLAKKSNHNNILICGSIQKMSEDVIKGYLLRRYEFSDYKNIKNTGTDSVTLMLKRPKDFAKSLSEIKAQVDGVFFARNLVNEPANILSTVEFSKRLKNLSDLGVNVEILEEKKLEELGMNALLGVGQGSANPSKVVVMSWKGASESIKPLVLVGKGVVFDTGGISLKPAGGMEDMTMDMGGAGVVAGTMLCLAKRKAKANVIGLVGLVENMPSSTAQRPGDIVKSMKGDTIEVINTDAEGRLVLSDVLWYAQEKFKPAGIIDLATLTGAIIVGLGYENAGVFSNDDDFCNSFLKAAGNENEGAWRMPLGPAYDKKLKSRLADMKNVGGRDAGAITAAQFIKRFIKEDMPWIHLDIAGVAHTKSESTYAPSGATGWGVMTLNRLISDEFEEK